MRLALTMRVESAPGYDETRDAISHDWFLWLNSLGHVPAPVPNCLSTPGTYLRDFEVDALVLTGGNDLEAHPGAKDATSAQRTRTEEALIGAALDAGMPVLGTCRGLHVINAYFDGGLTRDIEGQIEKPAAHVAVRHRVRLAPPFNELAGAAEIETNSFHNQGVAPDQLAPALYAFANCAEDGLVEGLVHPELPLLAIQWHPERPNPAAPFDRCLLAKLLDEGAFWKGQIP